MNEDLKQEIIKNAQWPYGQRPVQYQTIDSSLPGIRNMEHRYRVMNFPSSFENETVLDIGCSAGVVCFDAKKRGATRVVGIDSHLPTIEVAKKLAKEYDLDIEFYVYDINVGNLEEAKKIIGDKLFTHVFALSMWKHIDRQKIADLINFFTDKFCWWEGHANYTKDIEKDLRKVFKFKNYEYLGDTTDRDRRPNFKLR